MYIVYLYTFVDHEKVYIGLSDDLNFQLELEEKYLTTLGLIINSIDVVFFTKNKLKAVDEKKYWLAKTNNINKSFIIDNIPDDFISKSLKDRTAIKKKTEELESEYMSLFYKYETLKDNYKNVDELIERAISNSIEEWKNQNLSNFSTNNNINLIYDSEGYDEFGLDIEGFDRDGFDIDGYNKEGYDDYNFNKEGIHKDDIKKSETKVYKLEKVKEIQNKKIDLKNTIHKNSITKKDEEIKKLKKTVQKAKKIYKQKESRVIENIKDDKNNGEFCSFLSFLDAKKFVEKLRLESEEDWIRYCNNEINEYKAKPNYIPLNPKIFYNEWISWDNWLGKNKNYNKNYLSYDRAKKIISLSNINTEQKWHEFIKSNNPKITSIPTDPEIYYNNRGWISWDEWLKKDKKEISYDELCQLLECSITNLSNYARYFNVELSEVYKFVGNELAYKIALEFVKVNES